LKTEEYIEWLNENSIGKYESSRDSREIESSEIIKFSDCGLNDISEQICLMKNLHTLILDYNNIRVLPEEIINLKNLTKLHLDCNPLTLNPSQQIWIEQLKRNGCEVTLPSEAPNPNFTKRLAVDSSPEPDFRSNWIQLSITKEQYQKIVALKGEMLSDNISSTDIKNMIELEETPSSSLCSRSEEDEFDDLLIDHDPFEDTYVTLENPPNQDTVYILVEMKDGDNYARGSHMIYFLALSDFFTT